MTQSTKQTKQTSQTMKVHLIWIRTQYAYAKTSSIEYKTRRIKTTVSRLVQTTARQYHVVDVVNRTLETVKTHISDTTSINMQQYLICVIFVACFVGGHGQFEVPQALFKPMSPQGFQVSIPGKFI